jgi:ribose/xylose/arabinose/galactoside ABC-type transport system permease subunit
LRANPIIVSIAALALIYGVAEAFAAHGTIYAAAGTSYGGFKGRIAGIPVEFAVFLCVAALGQFILSLTTFGRNLFLIGSSFPRRRGGGRTHLARDHRRLSLGRPVHGAGRHHARDPL